MALNDMLMQGYYIIPLVHRGRMSAHATSLGGVVLNTWDNDYGMLLTGIENKFLTFELPGVS